MRNNFRIISLLAASLAMVGANSPARGDMITAWNEVLDQAIRLTPAAANPGYASRSMAMVNAAMFDAVNAVDHSYAPFHVNANAAAGTSRDAAAAQAAYLVLLNCYPAQKPILDSALSVSLNLLPDDAGKTAGVALGNTVGTGIVNWRTGDGSSAVVPYNTTNAPGHWQPDAINPGQQAWGPGWRYVQPFAVQSATQFQPPTPPALNSPEYLAAYNEVKLLGAQNSPTRTTDQTNIGIYWAYDRPTMGPPLVLYNQMLEHIGKQQGNTLSQNARMFGLASVAMADAGIAAWETKFADDFWRPITAIRGGDNDGIPLTAGDPNWVPLGAPGGGVINDFTPPFPAYVSGHATFGAAMFRTLANFYGTDDIPFTFESDELPGLPRTFAKLSDASAENGRSRIYLGIHWSFDDIEGRELGNDIADWIFNQSMVEVPEPSAIVLMSLGLVAIVVFPRLRRRR